MYIWILLATIMITLSFFNLSPRPDKDDSYLEAKASTIVSRLKMENLAVARFLQCEVQFRLHTDGWDANPPIPIVLSADNEFVYENGTVNSLDALPPGYIINEDDNIKHYVYCLDKPIDQTGALVLNPCIYGSTKKPAYVVSFAPIPDRWISKVASDGTYAPTPAFLSYLGAEDKYSGTAGYTKCKAANNCQLLGVASHDVNLEKVDVNGVKVEKKTYVKIAQDSPVWNNAEFNTLGCKSANTPCMLIYRPLNEKGGKGLCRKLITPQE